MDESTSQSNTHSFRDIRRRTRPTCTRRRDSPQAKARAARALRSRARSPRPRPPSWPSSRNKTPPGARPICACRINRGIRDTLLDTVTARAKQHVRHEVLQNVVQNYLNHDERAGLFSEVEHTRVAISTLHAQLCFLQCEDSSTTLVLRSGVSYLSLYR